MRGVIRFGGGEVVAPDDGPKPSLAFLTNGVEEEAFIGIFNEWSGGGED